MVKVFHNDLILNTFSHFWFNIPLKKLVSICEKVFIDVSIIKDKTVEQEFNYLCCYVCVQRD